MSVETFIPYKSRHGNYTSDRDIATVSTCPLLEPAPVSPILGH